MKFSNAVLRLFLPVAMGCLLTACTSYRLPKVPPAERGNLGGLTVGFERSRTEISPSDPRIMTGNSRFPLDREVVAALRRRGAFKEVAFVDELSSRPDVVVKDPRFTSGQQLFEPMLVILTLGLVPQDFRTFSHADFELKSGDGTQLASAKRDHEDTGLMGWAALPLRLSSRWSAKKPDSIVLAERFAHDIEDAVGEQYSGGHSTR